MLDEGVSLERGQRDAQGRLRSVRDGDGASRRFEYDDDGRLVRFTGRDQDGAWS
ncbi:MAG: RHS repeat domain-containing protein [Sandaracinaceae bacterium]